MRMPIYCFLKTFQLYYLDSVLSVSVYVVNGITTPCLTKKISLRTPSTHVSLIRIEFESTHTEAGLVGVGGLVAWLEACVDFPQWWSHSDLSRFEPPIGSRAFLFRQRIFSCLQSECVTPCLSDLLEFRRAERVPWFADLLAFILIAISVNGEFQGVTKAQYVKATMAFMELLWPSC